MIDKGIKMSKKWDEKPQPKKQLKPHRHEILIGHDPDTNFTPTKPGNKATRKPGLNYRQDLWNKHVRPHLPEIYEIAMKAAKHGDPDMIKLFLSKSMPKNPIDKPLTITADANQQIAHIIAYCAEGHISPDEAVKLSTIVKDRVSINEIKNFADKMTAIEQWIKDRDQGVTINAINNIPETKMEQDNGSEKELDSGSNKE